jgi:hypothetical protein
MTNGRILAEISQVPAWRRKFHNLEIGLRRKVLEILNGNLDDKSLKKAVRRVKSIAKTGGKLKLWKTIN